MVNEKSKSAIVTGGSRGIGEAIAKRLAQDGFSVAISYARDRNKAEEVAGAIESAGGKAIAIQGDVAELRDVQALYHGAVEAFGQLDVVVNSAGIMPLSQIAQGNFDDFDRTIATNLRGTFAMMVEAAKHIGEGGRFIALSSSVIAKSTPGYGAYIASKAGVEELVRVFAHELRGRNITVNAIAPGPIATELFLYGKSEELIARIVGQAPLERIGQPHDIASAVSFLAGPDGAWINAQVLRANGGFA
jgi:3-oxoacyl-[acyl-carrier protein] reductase